LKRPDEIVEKYLFELDKHMADLKQGRAESTFEIKDLADLLFIHPTHLSNTIHDVLGKSPCDIYEERLLEISKELILGSDEPISRIAEKLTFDPSNFSKFFKHFEKITPKKYRDLHRNESSELLTITDKK
jgi:AraC family transcriptional regulator, regulatory protein of adaptative response / methylphosphotriester-DNA alkyltransferase methyltransferase